MNKPIIILGIESSCDDTSAAIIKDGKVLSNIIASQEIHAQYGGVVPELASRAHQQNIIPVVDQAIKNAKIKGEDITAVAFTKGPGLLGSLLVGVSFAKSFAMAKNIPLIEVNHMQAHILAHFIVDDKEYNPPSFPFLCLTVSGGHTQIVKVSDYLEFELLGQTLDDAAGEAFDKSAKILGLPYPGGPLIDKYAKEGNPEKFKFSKPKVNELDFSFSGLKTSILYFLKKEIEKNHQFINENLNDLCASIQKSIIDVLIEKITQASNKYDINEIAIAGGVSANSYFRKRLKKMSSESNLYTYIPKLAYCTDNAAMIAITGHYKFLKKEFTTYSSSANSRMSIQP